MLSPSNHAKGTAHGCLHVVVQLGWEEGISVGLVEEEEKVGHARQTPEDVADTLIFPEQNRHHMLVDLRSDLQRQEGIPVERTTQRIHGAMMAVSALDLYADSDTARVQQ